MENDTVAGFPPVADPQEDHSDLVRRAQAGDRSAFGSLVEWYGGQAFATAYAILRDRQEAEDAVQEAFIKAYRYLEGLNDPLRFGPWLRSIVRQECCGLLRRLRRKVALLSDLTRERSLPDSIPRSASIGSEIYRREIWDCCLSGLTEKAREIVILHYTEGFSCEQIAGMMNISEGTVKSHLFKARRKIEIRLERMGVRSVDDI
ncbi:MAG TPA: RNA polymerase sigma factor [bacterium]|nr:RNA polymerase sigma factor [bacterium]HPO09238.1 RNA polymerase sigma factor [bacterium]